MKANRVVRKPEAMAMTGLSCKALERLEHDGHFPRRKKINRKAYGWTFEELTGWLSNDRRQKATDKAVSRQIS